MGTALYDVQDATRTFRRGDQTIRAVDGVSLHVDEGEFVALEGPSGSGKTTLLQLLGALDRPSAGEVLFEGRDLARLPDHELAALRLRSFGFVFQQFNLIPTLSAVDNVEAKLAPVGGALRERLVVGTETLDFDPVDRQNAHVARRPYARRAGSLGREERALTDHGSRPELACAVRRVDDDRALHDHVETRAVLAVLDQHPAGGDVGGDADRFERTQIVRGHRREYRKGGKRSRTGAPRRG